MIASKYFLSLSHLELSLAKSSLHPGLQKPTLCPRYSVIESAAIGLPDLGRYLLIAFVT